MRLGRLRKIAQGGDWFSWVLPTLLCLILIACLTFGWAQYKFPLSRLSRSLGRTDSIGYSPHPNLIRER
jgi:hypothetical protein